MDRTEKETELVIQTLEALGYVIKKVDDPSYFWIFFSYKDLIYEVAVCIERLKTGLLYFSCELPFVSKLPFESLLLFYNKVNARINFGKFYFNDEMETNEFQHGCKYLPNHLSAKLIEDTLHFVVQTPINYEYAFSEVLKRDSITTSEMDEILNNKPEQIKNINQFVIENEKKSETETHQNLKTKDTENILSTVSQDSISEMGEQTNVGEVKGNFKLIFVNPGTNTRMILVKFKKIFGFSFTKTREIRSSCPYVLKDNLTYEQAIKFKEMFDDIDADFEVLEQKS